LHSRDRCDGICVFNREVPDDIQKKSSCFTYCVNYSAYMSALQNESFIISIFLKQTSSQRFYFIKKQKRCSNCFSAKHSVKDCTNPCICRQCSKHQLLHFNQSAQSIESEQSSTCASAKTDNVNAIASYVLSKTVALNIKVLLATVCMRVYSPCKRFVTIRALLDQESVSTFIIPNLILYLTFILPNRLPNGCDL